MTYGSNQCESDFVDEPSGTVEGKKSRRERAAGTYKLIRLDRMIQIQ